MHIFFSIILNCHSKLEKQFACLTFVNILHLILDMNNEHATSMIAQKLRKLCSTIATCFNAPLFYQKLWSIHRAARWWCRVVGDKSHAPPILGPLQRRRPLTGEKSGGKGGISGARGRLLVNCSLHKTHRSSLHRNGLRIQWMSWLLPQFSHASHVRPATTDCLEVLHWVSRM